MLLVFIIILLLILILIFFWCKDTLLRTEQFSIKYYINKMIRLQNLQVELTSQLYNSNLELTPELSNVASFIMQNIPQTTKILTGMG